MTAAGQPAAPMLPRSGILPIDKPEGPTSHDVVARARRALGVRRIGHTGTLDPFASGLLLLCVGSATRIAEYLTGLPKTYRAIMRVGELTDTDDLSGEVIRTRDEWRALKEPEVRAALERQVGTFDQLPPLYSAKKVAGERLYAAARRGETPPRTAVPVTILRLDVLDVRLPDVEFEVECSSGTYVRAIARDAGEALGVGAHLRSLRRTHIGPHEVASGLAPDELDDHDRVRLAMISPLAALSHLRTVVLDGEDAQRVAHGRSIVAPGGLASCPQQIALATPENTLLAVGELDGDVIRPRKVFPSERP